MNRKSLLLLGGLCVVLSFGGCDSNSHSNVPICATNALMAPELEDPAMWETVDSLMPTLSWSYPDSTCTPESYRVALSTGPFFADDLGGATGDPSTAWSPDAPLEPGKEYAWYVRAMNGTTLGPFSNPRRAFFTGPSCEADNLKTPRLLQPGNDAIIADDYPPLIWDYPDACLPGGYGVNLSTSPNFEGSPLNGGTGHPSTTWYPGVSLTDCTRYYWRIVACLGGQCGQYSDVRTFRVEISDNCPAESP